MLLRRRLGAIDRRGRIRIYNRHAIVDRSFFSGFLARKDQLGRNTKGKGKILAPETSYGHEIESTIHINCTKISYERAGALWISFSPLATQNHDQDTRDRKATVDKPSFLLMQMMLMLGSREGKVT